MSMFKAVLRKGTMRPPAPDPGMWVMWNGLKFYSDANVVYIEGHDDAFFVLPAEVKIMESFLYGVIVTDGNGHHYLLRGCAAIPKDLSVERLPENWRAEGYV